MICPKCKASTKLVACVGNLLKVCEVCDYTICVNQTKRRRR